MKQKMDSLTKYKLVYSGEFLFFALLLTVLGFLFAFSIIPVSDWKKWLFTILTLAGGIWIVIDFIWTIKSKKRRAKNPLIDKIILLPEGLALLVFDIYALVQLIINPSWTGNNNVNFFQIVITIAMFYVAAAFYFEAIYHFFKVHPLVYEMIEEEEKEKASEEKKEQ